MPQPPSDSATLFEDLLQDPPAETVQLARAFKALPSARQVRAPRQLLRPVRLYGGLDQSRREGAGPFTWWVGRPCRQQNRKKGHQPKQLTVFLAGWVLVVTTLPPTLLSRCAALAVYQTRWQIEVAVKRWKSVLNVDLLWARYASPFVEVWLHGKLLYVLLLARRLQRPLGEQWCWLDRPRTATWWHPWTLPHDEVAPAHYRGPRLATSEVGRLLSSTGGTSTPPPAPPLSRRNPARLPCTEHLPQPVRQPELAA
jgi:hypothetical protein